MIFEKEISNFNFPINFKSFLHLIKLIYKNKSPIRIFHNYFLKNILIEGKTIDLGCGNHSSYLNFLKKSNTEIFFADKDILLPKFEWESIATFGFSPKRLTTSALNDVI